MSRRMVWGLLLAVGIATAARAQARSGVVPAVEPAPAAEPARAVEPEDDPPYDSAGRRDPFKPPRAVTATLSGEARTPLQRYEVGQLRLVAIIYEAHEPRAVVEDDDGLGYILKAGTLVGANGGHVRTIERGARRYRLASHRGQAIGRIRVPRLHLNMILVNGTDHDSLKKGPGRDLRTYMPGEGQLIYIAGHRTTYLAPFAHIDSMRRGDLVTLEVPYATFVYRVFRKKIVPSDDLAVLHSQGREVVALQACHPRFFATNRYIVWGRLIRIEPRGAAAFTPPSTALAAAPLAAAQG